MRTCLPTVSLLAILVTAAAPLLADQVETQNGDRYNGKVLSMSADTILLQSEVLGKIKIPRRSVANLVVSANPGASMTSSNQTPVPSLPVPPAIAPSASLARTNVDLSASLRSLGANTNFIRQIREQMLAGATPEASSKYDELVSGLMSGKLNLNDIRRQAQSSADQLRTMKHDLGPEAGEVLDVYLNVLDNFLKETASESNGIAAPKQKN